MKVTLQEAHFIIKKLYIKKRTWWLYVLLSARRGRRSLAGRSVKCQTEGIYLAARLLLLITQHYCLYNLNSRRRELRNKQEMEK